MDFEHQECLKSPTAFATGAASTNGKGKNGVTRTSTSTTSVEASKNQNSKIVVFLPTTRGAQLHAKVFASLSRGKEFLSFESHSAKDHRQRTLPSRNFRRINTPAVLFTSDVSARGIDYPGVGLVVEVGAPLSLDHYIHRNGRTGRGDGKKPRANGARGGQENHGKGILVLGELNEGFTEHQPKPSSIFSVVKHEKKYDDWQSVMLSENLDRGFKKALSKVDMKLAFLGYRSGTCRNLLEAADSCIAAFGVEACPAVSISFLERLGFMKQRSHEIQDGGKDTQ